MRKKSRAGAGPSHRQLRAGELIRRALIEALAEGHLRDTELVGASITVSEVRLSPDLKHASAFVLPLGGNDTAKILPALKRAAAYLRMEVARRVELRNAPQLHFELDGSFERGTRIEALLRANPVKPDTDET